MRDGGGGGECVGHSLGRFSAGIALLHALGFEAAHSKTVTASSEPSHLALPEADPQLLAHGLHLLAQLHNLRLRLRKLLMQLGRHLNFASLPLERQLLLERDYDAALAPHAHASP